jgi:hypothetical protein
MSNILIGSSNVVRFYKASSFSNLRQYTLVRCTEEASFKATMEDIDGRNDVVISTIENFISTRVGANVQKAKEIIVKTIEDFLEVIEHTAERMPDSRFGVVMPLQRPSLEWYQNNLDEIKTAMADGIVKMKKDNVNKIECPSALSQAFEKDGVHLTKDAGKCFLTIILEQAENYFDAEIVNLTENESEVEVTSEEEEETTKKSKGHSGPSGQGFKPDANARLDKLEAELAKRKLADNIMFARIREELDTIANKSKEDRVVLSGLVSKAPIPVETTAKIEALKKIAIDTFNFLIPDFDGKISFVSQGKAQGLMLPMLEVRLERPESAAAIRKAFAMKNKQGKLTGDFAKLFVSNSVNLATRVRIDVMKAIAKKVTNDDIQAYVVGFISRPIMHLRKKSDGRDVKPHKSLTFTEAIENYGQLIYAADLERAYTRAGSAFKGVMQQNFVVLHDKTPHATYRPAPRSSGYPRGTGPRGHGMARGRGGDRGGSWSRSKSTKRPGDELSEDPGKHTRRSK